MYLVLLLRNWQGGNDGRVLQGFRHALPGVDGGSVSLKVAHHALV